jgi:hypothetical protein
VLILMLIWLLTGIGLCLVVSQGRGSVGLPLAYFVGLSLIHVPGAMLYFDGDDIDSTAVATTVGFQQTIIGMVAFLGGVLLARYAFVQTVNEQFPAKQSRKFSAQELSRIDRLVRLYLWIGAAVCFVAGPVIGAIPSATAIFSPLGSLLIVGACLRLWVAREQRSQLKFWSTLALLPLLPLATVVQGGFIGFGIYWTVAIAAFFFATSRSKAAYVLVTPAVFFVGLSIFVNYAAARDDIRRLVWYEQVSIGDRLERIADVFQNFMWLDLSDPRHRGAIDARLNQNVLIGVAVDQLQSGAVEYASGATVGNVILALVPRALWPDKPAIGGGGTIVHDFTGIEFAEGTSVGAGQVFEFYVNFGTLGVICGFLLYGFLIGRLDFLAKKCLDRGDQRRFLFFFLICLDLLQPGGNLLEIVAGAAASAITAYGLGRVLARYWLSEGASTWNHSSLIRRSLTRR